MNDILKGLRKWSVAMSSLTCAFILALLGKLTGDFVTITGIIIAAFHMGNAVETRYGNGNGNNGGAH